LRLGDERGFVRGLRCGRGWRESVCV
jgi:hypothetical protein